jgi:signal transduction histidine kinase/ligand-binding sensor domain-containing protein
MGSQTVSPNLPASALRASDRKLYGRLGFCFWQLLAVFCFVSTALAQHHFDSWTTDNGLPHNWIRAIHQTRDGYIWLPTLDGLARFDGLRFKVFNRTNTPGLTSNRFSYHALWEDRQGNLWLGTEDGGVIRCRDGVFSSYTTREGLPDNSVTRIDEDAAGTVWFFTKGGLAQWRGERLIRASGPDGPFDAHLATPKSLGVDGVFAGLWRMSAVGWERFAYGQWTPLPLPPRLTDPAKLLVDSIVEDSQRRLWYDLKDREDEYYCVDDGRLTVFPGIPNTSGVHVCHEDRRGRLWVGSQGGVIRLWKDGRVSPLRGFSTAYIFKVLEDREGTLWIATLNQGLYRLREQVITVYRHPGGPQFNTIGPMMQDRAGNVWAASGGLARFKSDRFENSYRQGRSHNTWDWGNMLSALYEDHDGSLWVGTWDGIVRFKDGRLHEEKSLSAQIKGRVYAIRRDRAGDLWLGGDSGLSRLSNGELTHYTTRDGLSSDNVKVVLEDRAGTLWIGTNGGLSRFANGGFTSLTEADGLPASQILSLYEDDAGVLWIGTYDSGLARLKESPHGQSERKLTRYTTEHGLFNNGVYQILEDDLGFLWISCHLGLYRVRKQELNDFAAGRVSHISSTNFGKADGLVNVECGSANQPSASGGQPMGFKASDGKLWFPTQEGIAVVDPKGVQFNPTSPPVVIEECLLDRHPIDFRDGVTIRPGQESLEINYTGLSLIKSEQIRFKYKLEGLDHDWIDAGTRRTAYYSHVPPGEYVFTVIAANSDGVWNTKGKSLQLVVLPPFYRTWWFLALATLGVVGVVLLGYQYRIRQLKREQSAQQAFSRQLIASQEAERKQIALEIHDELGQSLTALKVDLSWVAEKLPQNEVKLAKRIEDMTSLTGSIIETVQKITTELRPGMLDNLGLKAAIEWQTEEFSSRTGIDCNLVSLEEVDGLDQAQSTACFRILQETLTNIARHANATQVKISMKREDDRLILQIHDNGRGISESEIADRTSIGLLGMKERAQALGGEFNIKGIAGKGTSVTVSIPLAPAADRSVLS